jgi:hypothetical protein
LNKYIIAFCEGEHDIALITRILLVNGYNPYQEKVKDFPIPLNKLYMTNLGKKKLDSHEFKFQRPKMKIPHSVLVKDNVMVIFHNFDGDTGFVADTLKKMMSMYLELNKENIRKITGYEKLNFRFLCFLDADEHGLSNRLENLGSCFNTQLQNHSVEVMDDYELGCYIFHDDTHPNGNGQLEDLILSLIKERNQQTVENGVKFIKDNSLDEERCKKYNCDKNTEEYKGSSQFKQLKSIISVAGQLQFSGSSNAVIIANSDYIQKEHLLADVRCISIASLFNT